MRWLSRVFSGRGFKRLTSKALRTGVLTLGNFILSPRGLSVRELDGRSRSHKAPLDPSPNLPKYLEEKERGVSFFDALMCVC